MDAPFAKVEIDKLSTIAEREKDGYMAIYFDRKGGVFTGASVGMDENDAVVVINQLINQFKINRTKLSDFIAPAILLKPPFGKQ